MSLIITDPTQWVCEHCSTKEDIQYYIDKLQKLKSNWVDEIDEDEEVKEPEYKKYSVQVSYRYTIDLNILATSIDRAREIADEYACTLPITDKRFCCNDGYVDAWEESFDDAEIDIREEEW